MKKAKIVVAALVLVIALFLFSCAANSGNGPEPGRGDASAESTAPSGAPAPEEPEEEPASAAQQLLAGMTTEEKIGQLFIIRPEALLLSADGEQAGSAAGNGLTEMNVAAAQALQKYRVGGIAMFGQNISSPQQITSFIQALQASSPKIPLFIAVDEEGGSVARVANTDGFDVPKFKSMQDIGQTGDPENARAAGNTIGAYLKRYGFNLDFAPDADVNTNPENIVIGNRSFGSDPVLVSEMVAAAVEGFHEAGMMTCVKHFPGHGDTKGDTHKGFVSIEKTWSELKSCELLPFVRAMESSTDMVMISHITMPNVTSDGLPASLSREIITEKLRGELKYGGVVITDALEMGAIARQYTSAQSAVAALQAGADILLMPENFADAYNGVYAAVQNGTVSMERLDESVMRILALKEQYGLI